MVAKNSHSHLNALSLQRTDELIRISQQEGNLVDVYKRQNVDVAKRSMSAIAGTAQERIFAIELLRQQHTVAVERQESILALEELNF